MHESDASTIQNIQVIVDGLAKTYCPELPSDGDPEADNLFSVIGLAHSSDSSLEDNGSSGSDSSSDQSHSFNINSYTPHVHVQEL